MSRYRGAKKNLWYFSDPAASISFGRNGYIPHVLKPEPRIVFQVSLDFQGNGIIKSEENSNNLQDI